MPGLPNRKAYGLDVDEIGDALTEIERHLEVAGLILGEAGPRTLDLGTQDRTRAFEAVCDAFSLAEKLLGRTGNTP